MKLTRKIFIAVSFIFIGQSAVFSQSNNCATATVLTVNAAPVCGQTTAGSNVQVGEYIIACTAAGIDQTVWYQFTATQSNMDVWIENSATGGCHIAHAIYNTNACLPGAGNLISCKDNTAPTDMWHHLTGLTIGNIYLIQVMYNAGGPCGGSQTFCISVVAPPTTAGYTQPTTGTGGEFVGTCMTNTCTGQFYDDGGAGSNYSDNINLIYRTFCPDAVGQCIRATVNYMDAEAGWDYMYIIDGATQNDPSIAPCNPCSQIGNQTFTATSDNGCLGFRFKSDATNNYAGWNISLSCVPCAANTTGNTNTDCGTSTAICSNATFAGTSVGPGISSDGCSGCNTSEHYTNWYNFCAQTSGSLNLVINPNPSSQDYDFALYGPGVACGSLGSPIRCSYASTTGNTGLGNGAVDNSEDVSGNGWVAPLNVIAGECYYLMVNKWDVGGTGFTVNFTGSTASLDCSLPVELAFLNAKYIDGKVILDWETASEENNDFFTVEKSKDGNDWKIVGNIDGAGNSSVSHKYSMIDKEPYNKISYYRLKQTDFNGKFSYSDVKVVFTYSTEALNSLNVYFENSTREIFVSFNGVPDINYFYSVYDITGRPIKNGIITSNELIGNEIVISTQDMSQGIYSFVLKDNITLLQKRIIITK